MGFADHYLARYSDPEPIIVAPPSKELKYIVVIPAFNESGLINSLDSLFKCSLPEGDIEVIVVINWPEGSDNETVALNKKVYEHAGEWSRNKNSKRFGFYFLLLPDVHKKIAGVGYARKYGMDEAVRRFSALNYNGIILSYDADSLCDVDLFTSLDRHFSDNPDTPGCNIRFEHPLEGNDFPAEVYDAIILYELHLRYYYQGLKYTGHPNCYHTVGSSFAIRAESYCSQGGMNKRKAGEDFYFLQKFFDLGTFSECRQTRIIPSPRPSSRVPFGTGPAVKEYLLTGRELLSFNPVLFDIMRSFFEKLPVFFEAEEKDIHTIIKYEDKSLHHYLKSVNFSEALAEIKNNSAGYESFRKRFFRWFNMFRILKFLNSAVNVYPEQPVTEAAGDFYRKSGAGIPEKDSLKLLMQYREWEYSSI